MRAPLLRPPCAATRARRPPTRSRSAQTQPRPTPRGQKAQQHPYAARRPQTQPAAPHRPRASADCTSGSLGTRAARSRCPRLRAPLRRASGSPR
eukprot:808208-Rhodomonas_salina.3